MNKLLAAIVALESEAKAAGLNVQVSITAVAGETHAGPGAPPSKWGWPGGTHLSVQSIGGPVYSGGGTTAHEAAGNLLTSAGAAKNDADNVIASFGPAPVS